MDTRPQVWATSVKLITGWRLVMSYCNSPHDNEAAHMWAAATIWDGEESDLFNSKWPLPSFSQPTFRCQLPRKQTSGRTSLEIPRHTESQHVCLINQTYNFIVFAKACAQTAGKVMSWLREELLPQSQQPKMSCYTRLWLQAAHLPHHWEH